MLLFSFSLIGLILLFFGHIFHALFLTEIKKISFPSDNWIIKKHYTKSILFYILSITIFITGSVYSTPSTVGVIFAFFIILYDLYCFKIIKKSPTIPCLYYPSLYISLLAIIINALYSPPSFDNIGLIEVIHLLYSPVGSYLTFLYIFLQILFSILSHKRNQISSILSASLSFASVVNLTKLMGNCITLSIRIENQFQIYLFYPFALSFIISLIWYFFSIKKALTFEMSGIYRGIFYFSYLVFQISSATLLYGEPMLLNPIQLGIFLSTAVLLVFAMFAMSCGAWPLLPSDIPRYQFNFLHRRDQQLAIL